jgi:hypothetical protein
MQRIFKTLPYDRNYILRKTHKTSATFHVMMRVCDVAGKRIQDAVTTEVILNKHRKMGLYTPTLLKYDLKNGLLRLETPYGEHVNIGELDSFICYVCNEDVHVQHKRVSCPAGHKCCKECAHFLIEVWSKADVRHSDLTQTGGSMPCQHHDPVTNGRCKMFYKASTICRVVDDEHFSMYQNALIRMAEYNGKTVQLNNVARFLEKERQDGYIDDIQSLYFERQMQDATEKLLDICTLKCPHCGMVFADFTDCFAVCCSTENVDGRRFGCDGYFCAWCFDPFATSDDAHNHILNAKCTNILPVEEKHPLYTGNLFGHPDDFERANMRRREKRFADLVQNMNDDVRNEFVKRSINTMRGLFSERFMQLLT